MLKYIKNKIRFFLNLIKRKDAFILYKGFKKNDLLIYDDVFPHPVSGFRHEEISVLLSEFNKSKIIISSKSYALLKTSIFDNKKHIQSFINLSKVFKNKLVFRKGLLNVNTKLFYCIFINNIIENLNWLEKYQIPFVFTLYPGGGFEFDNLESDSKLKKVFASKMFKHVIVTQKITEEYLVSKGFCKKQNIKFIFGCVVPQLSLEKDLSEKKTYLVNKKTFDICFCAAKYMSRGEDKGYDIFIEMAHKITLQFDFVRFHIIGGFTQEDIDISKIEDKIKFYGYQNFENLEWILKQNDIIISPNKPFLLSKGAFDGFPLGTVVEGVLNGNVALVTDELKQNDVFIPNEEIIIIKSTVESIEKEIVNLIKNPEKLYLIAKKGREKFMRVYSNNTQMKPRIEILKNILQ
jgi:glycosyltransferase involved in cell wall biosynthesis